MPHIELTPSELRAKAAELEKLRAQHDDEMKRLRIIVFGLGDNWKGEAQATFLAKFVSMNQTFIDFSKSLGRYAQIMRSAADRTERLDNNLAAQIRRA